MNAARALLVLVLAVLAPAIASADCALASGGRVLLAADASDPDVFVWDARTHLIDYASGQPRDAHWILQHTIVAIEGTPAQIVACYPRVVHNRRLGTPADDAVGVRILSGTYRGRFGWVTSNDLKSVRTQL